MADRKGIWDINDARYGKTLIDDEKVRCPRCGAFASSVPSITEYDTEILECSCNKCGFEWREDV